MALVKSKRRWHVLDRLVKANGWTRGAELGVLKGETFLHLLLQNPSLHLLGVDTWEPNPAQEAFRAEGGRGYVAHDLNGYFLSLEKTIIDRGWADRAFLARTTTVEAAANVADYSFDFVFLDADHTYAGVSADIDAWLPKVRPGGMMLGHDYNPDDFPGVVKAVDERFKTILRYPDKVWGVEV